MNDPRVTDTRYDHKRRHYSSAPDEAGRRSDAMRRGCARFGFIPDPARATGVYPRGMARSMTKQHRLRPWHEVVRLKEELRTGELALAEFAADLHEVTLAEGRRPVYEDPAKFFALTYPTHALRELVKDVAARLAGRSDKAVRQLELTYGGGKTHTLITLHHLFGDPAGLPDLPAVQEFREYVGTDLPAAYTAALCFDKIDAERGITGVRGPGGETRALRHPWSVLAFQLGGADGLRAIHATGLDEERETPPAEPLLVTLLEIPRRQGLATLILVDEVLMYAREKAGLDPVWRGRIVDFFQYLTQAVGKVDTAAMVASLLATDPHKQRGELGGRLMSELFDVFRRQREEGVQPVQKEDVPVVLRRRFFEPDDVRSLDGFRSHIIGIVRDLARLDETTAKGRSAAEERFLASFPFHPDLTDVFYSRWTQLEGFQRTRGILRTLATALREAERWDTAPLIGPSALLAAPGKPGVSEAVRELAGIATSETVEGARTDWGTLLDAELDKARQIQDELPALRQGREAEQAVVTVFLHSQPIGRKAFTPELVRMVGSTAPDGIELEKGLHGWREISWFLDDEDAAVDAMDTTRQLPKSWRLGNRPNLRQMHDEACQQRVSQEMVEERLKEEVRSARTLTDGAKAAGATIHLLPGAPREVGDDGSFRYVILGADAASESGKPSNAAKRVLDETTGPDRPRVNRNAVVLAAPSRDGLEAARAAVRALLGWEDVSGQLDAHKVDPFQAERLRRRLKEARERVPDVVRQAYAVVVTVNEQNEVQAFKLAAGAGPLFPTIKNDERTRIKETAVDAEALLPDGPYDLWRDDEDARRVTNLAGAFARYPRLPKLLHPKILLDTVLQGVERGLFVARLARPDGSARTWWREAVKPEARQDPQIEVVLPDKCELSTLSAGLLGLDVLPELWSDRQLRISALKDYFAGGRAVQIPRDGYDETQVIPRCSEQAVHEAVRGAVERGAVWLTNGPASVWKEQIPYGVLDDGAVLHPQPDPILAQELVADALPGAWREGRTNGVALSQAISQARRRTLPWGLVRDGIKSGVESRWIEVADGSVAVNCRYDEAGQLRLKRPAENVDPSPPAPPPPAAGSLLEGSQIQDLAELIPKLLATSAGNELRFRVGIVLNEGAAGNVSEEVRAAINTLLATVSADLKTE